jgi:hypothetical protein
MDIIIMSTIADKLQDLVTAKEDMKTALIEKGVTPTGGLSTYADAVREISWEWTPDDGIKFWYSGCTYIPKFNTVNITDMSEMFRECNRLKSTPELETSHVTSMEQMFIYCNGLTTIPQYDTSSCTNMGAMLYNCRSLESIPLLEAGKCQTITSILNGSYAITELGGFKDLGKAMWTWIPPSPQYGQPGYYVKIGTDNAFNDCRKITRESCLNIFNNLYDVRENPGGYTPELKFESDVIARLTEEDITIAVNKGWIISSY